MQNTRPNKRRYMGMTGAQVALLIAMAMLLLIAIGVGIALLLDQTPSETVAQVPPTSSATNTPPVAPTFPPTWTPTPRPTFLPTWTPTLSTSQPSNPLIQIAEDVIVGDPQAYVLTIADLPDGFVVDKKGTGPSSNQLIASERKNPQEYLTQLEQWGRIDGYSIKFFEGNLNPFGVFTWITMMKSSSGAHDYFEFIKKEAAQEKLPVPVPAVGEESFGTLQTYMNTQIYEVTFRKQNIIAAARVQGNGESILKDANHYAQILEAHLSGKLVARGNAPRPAPTQPSAPTIKPSPTPIPIITRNETQTIGPILDSVRDEQFTMEITLLGVRFGNGHEFTQPKAGRTLVAANLRVKNLGPDASRSISSIDFKILDANGALQGPAYTSLSRDCGFSLTDLTVGGSVDGCVTFDIPDSGKVELIYAPFRYEGLKEGRYLRFVLRDK